MKIIIHYSFLVLNVLGVFTAATVVPTILSESYQKVFIAHLMMDTAHATVSTTKTLGHCASVCLKTEICTEFCYDRTNRLCYGRGLIWFPGPPLPGNENLRCYKPQHKICSSAAGYKMYRGKCLQFYDYSTQYDEARDVCGREFGHIYIVKSADDLDTFWNFVYEEFGSYSKLWVGADDLQQEGNFTWTDGTPVTTYLSWNTGEPKANHAAKNCVTITNESFKLSVERCDTSFMRFVCQVDLA